LKKRTKKLLFLGCASVIHIGGAQAQPVGNTNYATLPFVSDIYRPCWNCTNNQDPAQLFFAANPHSPFLNPKIMARARALAAAQSIRGIVPTAGLQRWEDTYVVSFPASVFPHEPGWISADRARGKFDTLPEFTAWRAFIASRPQYADIAFDGGTMPPEPDNFRRWGGQWGYISPLQPLDPADCPPTHPQTCTWGDDFAYRWAQTSKLTGGYGLQLSDFTDGQPYPNTLHDFNPRIVAAFAKTLPGGKIPGATTKTQAAWINTHAYSAWTDFLAEGYSDFYATLARDVGAATHHAPLVIGQCNISPSFKRMGGVDERILATKLSPDNFMCIWDDQVIQLGRSGPIRNPPVGELSGYILAAARDPQTRNGANLEADDAAFWAAMASFYPGLPEATRQELGLKLLKRLWVWSAWAHIADANGTTRRALAFASRNYWDGASIARIGPAAGLIRSITPAHPFGAALYYSVAVERRMEAASAGAARPGEAPTTYLMPPVLQKFLDGGSTVGYYVSDAALPALRHENAPSAWVVLGPNSFLPLAERKALQSVAPIVTSAAELAALSDQPLKLSPGLAGFAFISSAGKLVVVVSNPSSAADARSVPGSVRIAQSTAGAYRITEMQSGSSITVHQANGVLSWPLTILRWDTQIYTLQHQ
jgi:hypothetical protein